MTELSLATWNIAAEKQEQRVGAIAEYVASKEPGITILTELTAITALKKALTREIGSSYSLGTVPTGSPYEDSLGVLVTDLNSELLEEVEAIGTGGKKMPYFMRAVLSTPLGGITMAAMRGAYVSGKGGLLTTGSGERKVQYRMAIDVLEDGEGIALIGGDMNSPARTRDPVFTAAGYQRLTGEEMTWPDRLGIKATTKDAQILAMPFMLLGNGSSIDAIYGKGPIESVGSETDASGLSDHLYTGTKIRLTNPD